MQDSTMELIILKSGDQYIRVKDGGYHYVALDKASVFPLGRLDQVKEHLAELRAAGDERLVLKKLVITEKDFYS